MLRTFMLVIVFVLVMTVLLSELGKYQETTEHKRIYSLQDKENNSAYVNESLSALQQVIKWGTHILGSQNEKGDNDYFVTDENVADKIEVISTSTWIENPALRAFMARYGQKRSPTELTINSDPSVIDAVGELLDYPIQSTDSKLRLVPCPVNGIITVQDGGRLGNKLFEYAAVWGIARWTRGWRSPLVPQSLLNGLSSVFGNLSLSALEQLPTACQPPQEQLDAGVTRYELGKIDHLPELFPDPKVPLVVKKWTVLPSVLVPNLSAFRLEMSLRQELLRGAQVSLKHCQNQILDGLNQKPSRISFVGVHVRRTDFSSWLPRVHKVNLTGPDYFHKAMEHFRSRAILLGTPIFVVTSDDPAWVRSNLKGLDVCIPSNGDQKNPGPDLALLASCNHSIIDYGTFGMAAAILCGGETFSLITDREFAKEFATLSDWTFVEP